MAPNENKAEFPDMPPAQRAAARGDLVFGPFRLASEAMTLTEDGQPVALGHRALRVLAALATRSGEVISQDQLIAEAWPGLTVLPDNLRVQIAGLRRALNRGGAKNAFIINVPGRGYQFSGAAVSTAATDRPPVERRASRDVPALLVRVFGRAEFVQAVRDSVQHNRLTTIVGTGGIGKTTVALSAVRDTTFERIWFVDLGRVLDPGWIVGAVAAAVRISLPTTSSVGTLVEFFRQTPGLLLLDNCEHLLQGCAALVETLLARTDGLSILATSRHPLKAAGETVCKLYPLELPPRATVTMAEAQSYPAVQLLAERIVMMGLSPDLSDADAPSLVDICRRLDGLPLAIELAAATVGLLGLEGTAARLSERFDGLREGRSTAPQRQRTLWATFAWSYELLSPLERAVLRRVSFLNAAVSMEAICGLCDDLRVDDAEVTSALVQLVEKSLINVDVGGDAAIYSLLQTTREFARDATPPDEARVIAARHAALVITFLMEAVGAWRFSRREQWIEQYAALVDDAAAAFSWSLSEAGLGSPPTITTKPL